MSLPGRDMVARCKQRIEKGARIDLVEQRMVESRQRSLLWFAAWRVSVARMEAGNWCRIPRFSDVFPITMRVE